MFDISARVELNNNVAINEYSTYLSVLNLTIMLKLMNI